MCYRRCYLEDMFEQACVRGLPLTCGETHVALKDFNRECELTFESLLRRLTGKEEEPAIWSC